MFQVSRYPVYGSLLTVHCSRLTHQPINLSPINNQQSKILNP